MEDGYLGDSHGPPSPITDASYKWPGRRRSLHNQSKQSGILRRVGIPKRHETSSDDTPPQLTRHGLVSGSLRARLRLVLDSLRTQLCLDRRSGARAARFQLAGRRSTAAPAGRPALGDCTCWQLGAPQVDCGPRVGLRGARPTTAAGRRSSPC